MVFIFFISNQNIINSAKGVIQVHREYTQETPSLQKKTSQEKMIN
jgi:hypothetical protein